MSPSRARAESLTGVLGHRFARPELLQRALTHPSATTVARHDNQRLEFLGDRVLGLVIAEELMARYPARPEGTLAPRLNALVRRECLAAIAGEIGLGQHLSLGRSESLSGGRRKAAILADAMEAVIAALYLDGGIEAAAGFIRRHWAAHFDQVDQTAHDAKTALQEWAQGRGLDPPEYELVGRTGPDHQPEFTIEARLSSGQDARGRARSKKLAEQKAAAVLLKRLTDE